MDVALAIYLLIVLVCTYGFILFLYWWVWNRHASEVYIYIMLLFLAIAADFIMSINARWAFLTESIDYEYILTSTIWKIKAVPKLIILMLIVGRMTQRIIRTKRGISNDEEGI